jgi:hypothetical protein
MYFRSLLAALTLSAVSLALAATATAQHFDIFLARPTTGTQTVVGGADVDAQLFDDVTRVFESEMSALAGEFLALEPGVNHPNLNIAPPAYPASAAGLVSGDVLRLKELDFVVNGNLDDLFYWNGVGPVSFAPAAADFRIEAADPLTDTAGVGGAIDDHPFLFVDSDALPGIYLASVYGVVDGFDPSEPVYLVMGTIELITPAFLGISQAEFDMLTDDDIDEALEAVIKPAVEFVESNIVIPEPGALLLAAMACTCLPLIARRNRGRMPLTR